MTAPVTLFTFDRVDEAEWVVVDDGRMVSPRAPFRTSAEWTVQRCRPTVRRGGPYYRQ